MKRILICIILLGLIVACVGTKKSINIKSSFDKNISIDTLEYELLTFDSKFDTWYEMNSGPAHFRSKEYYEMWNRQYVSVWNSKSMSAKNSFFEPIVGYDPTVDYGFELNHKLFYYFQYVENVLKISILGGGGPKVVFSYSN